MYIEALARPEIRLKYNNIIAHMEVFLFVCRYVDYIKDLIYHSLFQAQLGGVPSTLNLVRSFLNLKQVASTPGLEVSSKH